jgi:phosphatidylserine/phosphatidylglycerophosphate/cardiolipin synthase-like enzyme
MWLGRLCAVRRRRWQGRPYEFDQSDAGKARTSRIRQPESVINSQKHQMAAFHGSPAVGLALALIAVGAPTPASRGTPSIHYAPAENLERIDVALIDEARASIDMAAYVLTDWPVMEALGRAAARGVRIRLYLDNGRIGEHEPSAPFEALLENPAIAIGLKRAGAPLMHLKAYQIDGRLLRTGAANFSVSGLKRQDNDLIIIENAAAAAEFTRHFEAIFAESGPLPTRGPISP